MLRSRTYTILMVQRRPGKFMEGTTKGKVNSCNIKKIRLEEQPNFQLIINQWKQNKLNKKKKHKAQNLLQPV